MIRPSSSKVELVNSLDLLSVDLRCELQDRDTVVRVFELVHVAEPAANPENLLGRSQHLQDLIAALIRPKQHRTAKGREAWNSSGT